MIIGHFLLDANEANAFVLGCETTREAALIDAGAADARIAPFLEAHGLRLTQILITHGHWDHVDGLADLLKTFPVEVYSFSGNVGGVATGRLAHGDTVRVGALTGRVVHTPGHTPDGIRFLFEGAAFCGDALFSGSVGGTTNEVDYERQLAAIREHLFSLPDDTEIFVGHGPSSTIGLERRYNPFFM